jgi:hypothetical protein
MKVFWFFFSKKNALCLARGRPAIPARGASFCKKKQKLSSDGYVHERDRTASPRG